MKNIALIRHLSRRFILIAVAAIVFGVSAITTTPIQAAPPQQAARIQLSFDRIGYEWWGRPFFMEDASRTDCYTNVGRRMLMLSLGVRIRNNSQVAMTPNSWNMVFTNNKGRRASWCFVLDPSQPLAGDTAHAILPIAPGATVAFAAQVFIEPNERVKSGYVVDSQLGRSNTVTVPAATTTPQ